MTAATITGHELAKRLQEDLCPPPTGGRREYTGKGWIAATEVSLQGRAGGRVDVLAAKTSYANFEVRAYEIKISRSDFRSDVTTGKWQRYAEQVNSVVFVTPKGLVTKDEIPTGAGWMVYCPTTDSFRMARKPTVNRIKVSSHNMLALMMALHDQATAEYREAARVATSRQLERESALGRHAARKGLDPANLDEGALCEWAMRKAGSILSERVRKAEAAMQELGPVVELAESLGYWGGWSSTGLERVKADLEAIKAQRKRLTEIASVATWISNAVQGRKVGAPPKVVEEQMHIPCTICADCVNDRPCQR